MIEPEARIDNHGDPKRDENNKKYQIPTFSIVPYDPSPHLPIPVAARVPPYDRPQWAPHLSPSLLDELERESERF